MNSVCAFANAIVPWASAYSLGCLGVMVLCLLREARGFLAWRQRGVVRVPVERSRGPSVAVSRGQRRRGAMPIRAGYVSATI